jgi:hypothetical protein
MDQTGTRFRWAGLSLFILLLSLWGCRPRGEAVPDQLIGSWHTSAPSHAGSTIEVSKELVVFTRDGGVRLSGRIVQCATVNDRTDTYYRLSYRDDDRNEYQLLVRYDSKDGGTLTFKNQPALVWKRTGVSL